ncbi:hypothetical protein SLE2022_100320 [Rubroshorea leprosula]
MDTDGEDFYAGNSDDDQEDQCTDGEDFFTGDSDDDQAYHDHDAGIEEEDIVSKPRDYITLTQPDIRRRMEDDVERVRAVLSVSKTEASTLLIHHNWNVSRVNDAWFADEGIREKVGLFEKPIINLSESGDLIYCGICFESYPRRRIVTASCGHPYCTDCWRSYVSNAINDGPGCLILKCPHPSRCSAAVGRDMIDALATDGEREKYAQYLINSYVEGNKENTKWCPAPGCECAINFLQGENFDVSCQFSHLFCWNCTEEAHRPLDCKTVEKWMLKNSSESENMTYVLAFTKPCPKCKRPIEKNQGCNHMTCRQPCGHEFCWICLGDWKNHMCNRYAKQDEDRKREMAKEYLERYTHYFERWANNEKSMKQALDDLKKVQELQLEKLADVQCRTEISLNFLTDAWKQIVECRRILKWTYAYGYYLPEEEKTKKRLFEHLQGQAESELERLHYCAERELEPFLSTEGPSTEFLSFQHKLSGLTSVTKNYFEKMVSALENGLSDVHSSSTPSPSLPSNSDTFFESKRPRKKAKIEEQVNERIEGLIFGTELWSCRRCTFINESHAQVCQVCGTGPWSCDYCTYASNPRTATVCEVCSRPMDQGQRLDG